MERSVNDQNSSTNIFTSYHYVVLYLLFYYDGLNKAVFVSSIRARAQADSFQRGSYASIAPMSPTDGVRGTWTRS